MDIKFYSLSEYSVLLKNLLSHGFLVLLLFLHLERQVGQLPNRVNTGVQFLLQVIFPQFSEIHMPQGIFGGNAFLRVILQQLFNKIHTVRISMRDQVLDSGADLLGEVEFHMGGVSIQRDTS